MPVARDFFVFVMFLVLSRARRLSHLPAQDSLTWRLLASDRGVSCSAIEVPTEEPSMRRLPLLLLLLLPRFPHAADAPLPPHPPFRVLLLFPSEVLMPWAIDQAENTRVAILAAVPEGVEFFAEGLDGLRLSGPDHEKEFVALLLKRYEAVPPDLIVVHGPMDGFVKRQRTALWPQTPLMAASVVAHVMSDFPPDVPGTTVAYDVAGTINLALRLQPTAKRLVVVAAGLPFSRAELENARTTGRSISGSPDDRVPDRCGAGRTGTETRGIAA